MVEFLWFKKGADNLHGGRDCMKLDPGVIMVFTYGDDERSVQEIEGIHIEYSIFIELVLAK